MAKPKLSDFLRVAGAAILLEVVPAPLVALMRRDLKFFDLAVVSSAASVASASMTILLAVLGFSYMSFVWAWVLGAALSGVLAIHLRPDLWVYRPMLERWRGMLMFGGCNGANVLLFRLYEALPAIILSRFVSFDAAGLYNRALLVCQVPDKIFLAGAVPVTPAHALGRGSRRPRLEGAIPAGDIVHDGIAMAGPYHARNPRGADCAHRAR